MKKTFPLSFICFAGKRLFILLAIVSSGTAVRAQTTSYNTNNVPTSGVNSVAIGTGVLIADGGQFNIGVGFEALKNNFTGAHNIAVGYQAMNQNVRGSYNTAVGLQALYNNQVDYNSAFGYGAMFSNTGGQWNTATGFQSLYFNNASYNTASGHQALYSNMNGDENVATGSHSLYSNIGGSRNTATGFKALYNNTQSYNTATGYKSLFLNTTGGENLADGAWALYYNTTGTSNTATGYAAVHNNTTGNNNTGFGAGTLFGNTTGENNTAIGWHSLSANVSGNNNTTIGSQADVATAALSNATAIGFGAIVTDNNAVQLGNAAVSKVFNGVGNNALFITGGLQVTGGSPATGKVLTSDASGVATWQPIPVVPNNDWSLTGNAGTTDGINFIGTTDNIPFSIRVNNEKAGRIDHLGGNTFFGYKSGELNSGNQNTAYGMRALTTNTTGSENTAIGVASLYSNTSGKRNTAVGISALFLNATGENNTAVGYATLVSGTAVSNNTAIGFRALSQNFAGQENTAVGSLALETNSTGVYNTATGYNTLNRNLDGQRNTANGWNALAANISGSQNTAAGERSLQSNKSGSYNTSVGAAALRDNLTGGSNTAIGIIALRNNLTGSANTAIGSQAMSLNLTGELNTAIGASSQCGFSFTNATAIGANAQSNASHKMRLGNTTVTVIEGNVMYSVSDGRFKTNISEQDVKGLEFIKKLRPVVYNFDTRRFQQFLNQGLPDSLQQLYMNMDFGPSTAIRQSGFIAQEVEAAAKETGYDFNGVHKPETAKDNYSLAYGQFVVPLVKAVQEQQQLIGQQQQQIDELRSLLLAADKQKINTIILEDDTRTGFISVSPNPFSGQVTVSYIIAGQYTSARIRIYTMDGRLLKTTDINNPGKGILNILTSGLSAGTYICTLEADGKQLDSVKLIRQ